MKAPLTYDELLAENERLRTQLEEATDTIEAIRTGQVDGLVVAGTDGTELYTLQTADQSYRVFIETMNEGAVTLDPDGLIVYCNSMFAQLLRMPLSQVIGFPFRQFVAPDCLAECEALFTEVATNQKLELTLCHGQEVYLPCLLSVTPLPVDGGTSISMIVTDLTALKAAQQLLRLNNERLEKANAALKISNSALNLSNDNLQQFAYVASHDLQEPLRKIRSFGDLLKSAYAPALGDNGVDMVDRMGAAARRMSLLIRDLLDYSRLTTQQTPFRPVDLNSVFTDVLDDLSMAVAESEAVIECLPLPVVSGDAAQLRQLFQNLLANALKFSQHTQTPQIQLSARIVDSSAVPLAMMAPLMAGELPARFHEINVRDNGIGFDEKYLDRIFQVFQRLHGKSQYPGSGVGLAICRKVVFNHHGALSARSQPGQGATFSVYLPV